MTGRTSGLRVILYFMERVSAPSTIAMACMNAEIYRAAEREAIAELLKAEPLKAKLLK